MTQYLLRLEYSLDYASTFSSHHRRSSLFNQDVQTQAAQHLLLTRNIHCVQLDHCTLLLESEHSRTLAVLALSAQYNLVCIDGV
jgi:hypothetical protein